MKRLAISERPDWREKATEFGFRFHTMHGEPYWCEDAYYDSHWRKLKSWKKPPQNYTKCACKWLKKSLTAISY